ncbi:MAG TPA: V-type ATP synthase subunit C [Oscillospiraceae bacterium]|nr:V-type ATP synthase subunit C [Oscillospiraceae bacterium]
MSNSKYTYAVGRIRAMETRLLDAGKIDRMATAHDAEEALKVLGETEYAAHLADVENANYFEPILAAERRRVYLELRKMLPEPDLINLFAQQFDYHNLKVLLKAHHLGEKRDELLEPELGNIPLDHLVVAVTAEDFSSLPTRMREAAEKIKAQFHPQLVDLWLDHALYEELASEAQRHSPFISNYFTSLRDLTNIKTFIRVKRLNRTPEFLASALLPAGELDLLELLSLEEPLEELVAHLSKTRYASVVSEGVLNYQQTETLTRYEKLADDFIINYVKQAKHYIMGPEPVVAYLLAKENELKMIRMIMVGKINQLPVEAIRERLRDVYV